MTHRIGIDPGSITSPTALAIIDTTDEKYEIIGTYAVYPCSFIPERINKKLIVTMIRQIVDCFPEANINLENPMLQGKAREKLYSFIGVLENYVEVDNKYAPCSVKKFMGHGKLEKDQMAQNLLTQFKWSIKSKNIINSLVEAKRFDETDAICIALCNVKEEPEVIE